MTENQEKCKGGIFIFKLNKRKIETISQSENSKPSTYNQNNRSAVVIERYF